MKTKFNVFSIFGLLLVAVILDNIMRDLDPNNNLILLRMLIMFMLGFVWPYPLITYITEEKNNDKEEK